MVQSIKIRGHHLPILSYVLWSDQVAKRDLEELRPALGTHEQNQRVIDIYKRMIENPNLEIIIIDSFDDICGICLKKGVNCSSSLKDLDNYLANHYYGLSCRTKYLSNEVIRKLKERRKII